MKQSCQTQFVNYRKSFPIFHYDKYSFEIKPNEIAMQFHYHINEEIVFTPQISLNCGKYAVKNLSRKQIEGIVFHIGLIELISYWKCTCSPIVYIHPCRLNTEQQEWWKKLYWKGLGEFFYRNAIYTTYTDFLQFHFSNAATDTTQFFYLRVPENNSVIVPLGGGKDSVVTLEHLRKKQEVIPFIINPRGATRECARIAGFPNDEDIVILHRTIDKKLLDLNAAGYLNGHTPFSAMLAFYSLLVSTATGIRAVALSNESSANEPTIPGTDINHQYSKSEEFELNFRTYVKKYIGDVNHYYSYLRPYKEIEIAKFFSQYPQYFSVFKSCNAGSKTDSWCCNCPKCLFAYIILSPFIDDDTMKHIFGEDLLDKPSLQTYFDELTGVAENKPFECVGTISEVQEALQMISESRKDKYLIRHYVAQRDTIAKKFDKTF